jgi:hypothetical protein
MSVSSSLALYNAVVDGNVSEMQRILAEGATSFMEIEEVGGQAQGLSHMLRRVVANGHEDMLRRLIAEPRAHVGHYSKFLLGEAVRCDRLTMVDMLLPEVKTNQTLEHAVLVSIDNKDRLGRLISILDHVKNTGKNPAKDQQGLSDREYFASQALCRAIWHLQAPALADLLTHTEARPNYDHGKALRETVKSAKDDAIIRLLVPVTDLERVRAYCAKHGEWNTLDQLSAFVPLDVATEWARRHRLLTATRARSTAHQRQEAAQEAQPTMTSSRPRRRT